MKKLGCLFAGYICAMVIVSLMAIMLLFSGGPEALCASATDEAVLAELAQLQRMGCPADVIMMVLSYLRDSDPETTVAPMDIALHYLQLRVIVETFECDCEASSWVPPPDFESGDTSDRPSCTCDWEFDRIDEYNTRDTILDFLDIIPPTEEPLTASNLQQRGQLAADLRCSTGTVEERATVVFQPATYTDNELADSITACGIQNSTDIKGMVELHRDGAFIEFLAEQARKFGFSEDDYIGQYPAPAAGGITCPFGYRVHPITNKPNFHTGIDIGTEWHTDIKSIADGTVVGRGTDQYNGRYILLRHEGGAQFYSYYGHLSQWSVRVGDKVSTGDTIGIEGGDPSDPEPGYSTGHHLHFEIRMTQDGGQVNPLSFLKRPKEGDEE